jgi:hypothetical protein
MSDQVEYCDVMEGLRHRLALIRSTTTGKITTGSEAYNAELIFLNFRKILESIAFGSLIAHKSAYSAAHPNFDVHWKAVDMLKAVERLNRDFYPRPLKQPTVKPDGTKHIEFVTAGFLSRDEFAELYDHASEVIHTRNPFSKRDPLINTRLSATEWANRIQALTQLHLIFLLDGTLWIAEVPAELTKRVHLYDASPLAAALQSARN